MRKKELPSFSALIAFEAAARHQSFKRAAAELCISQAAISRQIRLLEEYLGGELFSRTHRAVSLNSDGQFFLEAVTQGLNQIGAAASTLRQRHESDSVTIGLVSSMAGLFLAPRLGEFKKLYPDMEIYVVSLDKNPDPLKDPFDIMVRMDTSSSSAYESTFLFSEEIFPVCSPFYLEKHGPISTLEDLMAHTLLDTDDEHWKEFPWSPINWNSWFDAFQQESREFNGMIFSNYHTMINTVLSGHGICLGWKHLVGDLVKNGHLVRPLKESLHPGRDQYLLIRKSILERRSVRIFKAWFIDKINEMNLGD